MNFYELSKEYLAKTKIDSDLWYCLEYNPQPFSVMDIKEVLAVHEGERDEADWHWIIRLNDKRIVYLQGGCDYTGWDCQSSANCTFYKTPIQAAKGGLDEKRYQLETSEIRDELLAQLKSSKKKTWRENKAAEFDNDLPKI